MKIAVQIARAYAGLGAAYFLFQLLGEALTGGMTYGAGPERPVEAHTAAFLVTWLVSVIGAAASTSQRPQ